MKCMKYEHATAPYRVPQHLKICNFSPLRKDQDLHANKIRIRKLDESLDSNKAQT